MIDKYYLDFSKIYGRLMRLEMRMKKNIISSLLAYYKDDIITVYHKFFYDKRRMERYIRQDKQNIFLAILKNPQMTSANKFKHLIRALYLSDLLVLILNSEQFKVPEITNNFYYIVPKQFGELISAKKDLQNLRNAIAHYNFKDYEQNKNDYINALLTFEKYVGSSIRNVDLPKFSERPSIRQILLAILEKKPDLFSVNANKDDEYEYSYNKHRILLDLCDEIAMLNGYSIKDLPSPWTVLRQMYTINSYNKTDMNFNKEIKLTDLPLFKGINN